MTEDEFFRAAVAAAAAMPLGKQDERRLTGRSADRMPRGAPVVWRDDPYDKAVRFYAKRLIEARHLARTIGGRRGELALAVARSMLVTAQGRGLTKRQIDELRSVQRFALAEAVARVDAAEAKTVGIVPPYALEALL